MDLQRVVSYRQFCNKIWNAVRYALPLLEVQSTPGTRSIQNVYQLQEDGRLSLMDRWILSRLVRQYCNALRITHFGKLTPACFLGGSC